MKLDQQFEKFLEIFKHIHLNMSFLEILTQIFAYTKFLKNILSNKRKLEKFETMALLEECSAILQNELRSKLKDPRSLSMPCMIGNKSFNKALYDLGASISLMSLSLCKRIHIGELEFTIVTLQLVDRSIKYLNSVLENVPI